MFEFTAAPASITHKESDVAISCILAALPNIRAEAREKGIKDNEIIIFHSEDNTGSVRQIRFLFAAKNPELCGRLVGGVRRNPTGSQVDTHYRAGRRFTKQIPQ